MAFPTTYKGWVAYIRDWIGADEYSEAQISYFLDLAHVRINREMSSYGMEAVVQITTVDTDPIVLISAIPDFGKIRLVSVAGIGPLDVDAINEIKKKIEKDNGSGGDPATYCIDAGKLYIHPVPGVGATIDVFYYKKIPSLGGSPVVDSNVFTTDHPDALLYAACMESLPYQQDEENVQLWTEKYATALEVANDLPKRIKMGSTPLKRQITGLS